MTNSLEEINEVAVSSAGRIPFELFSKKNNKTTRLVNNDDENFFVKGKNDWYRFKLERPVFAVSVVVDATNYEYKKCEFQWKTPRSDAFETAEESFSKRGFEFEINDLITEFEFRPDQKYWGNTPRIELVGVEGFTLEELDNARSELSNLRAAKQQAISTAQKTIQNMLAKINRMTE